MSSRIAMGAIVGSFSTGWSTLQEPTLLEVYDTASYMLTPRAAEGCQDERSQSWVDIDLPDQELKLARDARSRAYEEASAGRWTLG